MAARAKKTDAMCEEHFPGGVEALAVGVTSVGCEHGMWKISEPEPAADQEG